MLLQQNAVSAYLKGPQRPTERVKKRGRPRKETPEHYAALLRGHIQIEEWFKTEKGRAHRSDAELYTAFRRHVFEAQHFETPKDAEVAEELLAVRLKTALNALGRARRYLRELHGKDPFTGMDRNTHTSFNGDQELGGLE